MLENLVIWLQSNQNLIVWVGISSLLLFIGTLIFIPIIIINIPYDYFSYRVRHKLKEKHPVIRIISIILKNIIGYIFILMGIAMIFLPGQGLLTISVGFFLIDFPLKYNFECWLINHRPLLYSINWIRKRTGKREIEFLNSDQKGKI
ncbi:MAG: hypothetical protein KAS49_01610 [Candidatus Cloacimonetes bacterium]|nr:hypothetical protein [Candidatus Cloacimonadota bacterium]